MLKEEDWTCPSSVILVHTEEKDDTDEEEEKEVCVCVVLEWEQYIIWWFPFTIIYTLMTLI